MTRRYQQYQEYKDSGVEWIGKVPEHWRVPRIKRLASICNGATPDTKNPDYWDGDINWFTPANLDNDVVIRLGDSARRITQNGVDSCAACPTPPRSVILSTRAPVGSIGITSTVATTNQGCRTLVSLNGTLAEVIAAILVASRAELAIRANGTTFQELSTESLATLLVPEPPASEQRAIAAAIDRETARIDALIEKKTRFIELLKEKRQAFITHAVTKGLDPNVKMKHSGVERIGEVPEHWRVPSVKRIATIANGATPDSKNADYWDGDITWFTPADLDNEVVTTLGCSTRRITRSGLDSCGARLSPAGSVVLSTRAPVGSVGITTTASATNQGCRTLVPTAGVSAKLLAEILVSARGELAIEANGTTFQELSKDSLSTIRVAEPSGDERPAIEAAIDRETARIDALIEKTNESIKLLKERRSAFITAAVTGQIDLREAA